jgi:signal transduction histidine kinase
VRIVTNLKNFSRASGENVPTDLHAGIDETLMLLLPRLRQACIQVTKRYGDLPNVVCRPGEMNQVFMNLLTNALHALEQRVGPGEREIVIETRAVDAMAEIAFEDNGPGVPDELATNIFEPFFTTKPRGQGTGLGLSISTDIARRHGGTLVLERGGANEGGRRGGARFVCRIPCGRASAVQARSQASA